MLMPAMLAGTEAMVEALRGFVTWRHPHMMVSEMCTTSSSPVYQVRPLLCCRRPAQTMRTLRLRHVIIRILKALRPVACKQARCTICTWIGVPDRLRDETTLSGPD